MPSVSIPTAASGGSRQHARSITTVSSFHKEFGVPFALFDPARAAIIAASDGFPSELCDSDCAQMARRVLARGQAEVREAPGPWRLLALPVWKGGKSILIALGAFPSPDDEPLGLDPGAGGGRAFPAGASTPQWLVRWAQAACDRQRLADELRSQSRRSGTLREQLEASGKTLRMVDRLAAQLRISDRLNKFQKMALNSLFEAVPVASIAWVPTDSSDQATMVGQSVIDPDQVRRLVLEATARSGRLVGRAFVENRADKTPWGRPFAGVQSVLIVGPEGETPAGWLAAINRSSEAGFTPNDQGLMMPVASLLNVYRKNLNVYVDLKELLFGVVRALTSAIDAKDRYTCGHSERVARVALCLGRQMGLSSDELANLYLAGLLHDVGKIGVADHVLKKTGPLTPNEYQHVMSHVEMGVSILSGLKRLRQVMPGILHHHERYEGGGHPDGLRGDDIPLIARILAVADAFDAMSSDRSYRPRRDPGDVDELLQKGAGRQWDPKVIEAFFGCRPELSAIQQRGLGETLRVAINEALHQKDSAFPSDRGEPAPA